MAVKPKNKSKMKPQKSGGKTRNKPAVYDTDRVATNVYCCLLKDFRSSFGSGFREGIEHTLLSSLKDFRDIEPPGSMSLKPTLFKAEAQMNAFLAKYRFKHDVYTDSELTQLTLEKYFEDQKRICTQPAPTLRAFLVKQEARKIVKSILGKYQEEDVIQSAKFGKKSSIGCPLALAHIDYKLSVVKAFTGSFRVTKWFKEKILSKDGILKRFLLRVHDVDPCTRVNEGDFESLILKLVPKKWKIDRPITPLALLNLFYSFGIGEVVTVKLQSVLSAPRGHKLDIRFLQAVHRRLVKKFSKSRTHATADLTSASDSITSELLNSLLPRDWYVALKLILSHSLELEDGRQCYTGSVLPMGNGATFPLETLIFYSIIKAIGNLTHIDGMFSVYGDDLIYPSQLHPYVKAIFPELGLKLNEEKTFVESAFRESCGADYFHGVDVRPFSLQGSHRMLTSKNYCAFLYKTYNGLVYRWGTEAIRQTLFWILREISIHADTLYRVPPSYPATSGIHVQSPGIIPLDLNLLPWSPVKRFFAHGSIWHSFEYMLERSKDRWCSFVEPYYWLALQGLSDEVEENRYAFWHRASSPKASTPEVKWKRFAKYRTYFCKKRGKKVEKKTFSYRPYVAEKQRTNLVVESSKPDTVSDWI